MIDVERRRKWNYNETSANQFEKYVGKMNTLHAVETQQYPGQFPVLSAASPKTPKEAALLYKQQQLLQSAAYTPVPVHTPYQQSYVVPQVPQTPIGFIGAPPQYSPYKKRPF